MPKGEKGVPGGVGVSPENRLKIDFLPNRGNGVSKMVPGGTNMCPMDATLSKMLSKSSQIDKELPQLVPPAWFANRLGGTDAPAHAHAQTDI